MDKAYAAVTEVQRAEMPYPAVQTVQRMSARLAAGLGILLVCTASLLLVAMSSILFLQVIYRYVLELPLSWSEEAARFCLVWFGMLASCVAGQQGVHFSIRWCLNWLGPGPREIARIIVLAFGIATLGFIAYRGFAYLSVVGDLVATATEINMFWVYLAIPAGCSLLALIQALEFFDAVAGLITHRHFGRWRGVEEMAFLQLRETDQ